MQDNEKLNELLGYVSEKLQHGGDFVIEQAPLVAQEIVCYGRATTTASVLGSLLAIVIGLWLFRNLRNFIDAASEVFVPCFIGSVVITGFGVLAACIHIGPCLMAWFAPRLYLLHYLAEIVK